MKMAMGALVGLTFASAGAEPQLMQGEHKFCSSGRQHTVTYAVKQRIPDDDMYSLNTVEQLVGVQCDIDGSKVKLNFANADAATKFVGSFGSKAMVGTGAMGCIYPNATKNKGVMMKYALEAKGSTVDGEEASVHVVSTPMSYTQVYEKMNISYHSAVHPDCSQEDSSAAKDVPTPAPGPDHDKKICLGVNVDKTDCASPATEPVIFSAFLGDVTLKCSNCFVGIGTDIFFNINLDGGYLQEIEAGYRNTGIHAALELEMDGQASWSTGIDKTIWQKGGQDSPVIDFNIGPIPFLVWFETSGQFKSDISMDASAVAIAGIAGHYNIGDNYLKWDRVNHWTHVQEKPAFNHSTTVQGDVNVKTHADVTLTTMASMHVDKLFSSTMTFAPGWQGDITGDANIKSSPEVCADTSYAAALNLMVHLHVDLPFGLDPPIDNTWNKNLWNISGGLAKECTPVDWPPSKAKEVVV